MFKIIAVIILLATDSMAILSTDMVAGRYHLPTQVIQWVLCHDGVCPGCMRQEYGIRGGNGNCFDTTGDVHNCEGVTVECNWDYYLNCNEQDISDPGRHWCEYALFSERTVLADAIAACSQSYEYQVHCVSEGSQIEVPGIHSIDAGFSIGIGCEQYIDRLTVGYPDNYYWECIAGEDWSLAYWWIDKIVADGWYMDYGPTWGQVMWAASFMLGELESGVIGKSDRPGYPELTRDTSYYTEQARELLAHAIVGWNSCVSNFDHGCYFYDVLEAEGVDPFEEYAVDNPTQIHCYRYIFQDLIALPVATKGMSWSGAKGLYR